MWDTEKNEPVKYAEDDSKCVALVLVLWRSDKHNAPVFLKLLTKNGGRPTCWVHLCL